MKKYFKKAGAFLTCLAMVLTMLLPVNVSANLGVPPKETDTGSITVTNIKAEDPAVTVKAYKIVEGEYINEVNEVKQDLRSYQWTEKVKTNVSSVAEKSPFIASDNTKNLSTSDMALLAVAARKGELDEITDGKWTISGETYTMNNLNVGTYLVLISGSAKRVYNPILVSIYYTVDGEYVNTVSATDNWQIDTEPGYAKSTEPGLTKEITTSTRQTGTGVGKGDSVGLGDLVSFKVSAQIPDYTSGDYKNPTVKISDTLPQGLSYDKDTLKVKVIGAGKNNTDVTLNADKGEYTVVNTEPNLSKKVGEGFVITLTNSTLDNKNYVGKSIEVTYSAKVNENAKYNFDPNTNEAKYEYTNNPDGTTTVEKARTYNYTFSIDAEIYGGKTTINGKNEQEYTTHEIVKVDDTVVEKTWFKKDSEYWSAIVNGGSGTAEGYEDKKVDKSALEGAEFALYKAKADEDGNVEIDDGKYSIDGNAIRTATSDAKGALKFERLDAGKYILKETKAPQGYYLNENLIPIEIIATYNNDGTLAQYQIKIDNKNTSTYKATYEPDGDGKKITNITTEENNTETTTTYPFRNTKTPVLPSTGGMGTYIFTIIGVAVMLGAAGVFMARRRKNC